jgi:trehalose 6-phosphate phosphatase
VAESVFGRFPDIAREIHAAPNFLLCLDFDGTLAPIVPDPGDAQMPDETRGVLEALAARRGVTLAVVSGRSLADLQSRVGLDVILAGNHGLEIAAKGSELRNPNAAKWQSLLHQICADLARRIGAIPGALIEDKGLTASVHYRNVARADFARLAEMVCAAVEPASSHFFLRRGKKVFEILPRVRWHKGTAVRWIRERLRTRVTGDISVAYIGDDITDEFAFRELSSGITIRVGKETSTAARFCVRDTGEVLKFLKWLASDTAAAIAIS